MCGTFYSLGKNFSDLWRVSSVTILHSIRQVEDDDSLTGKCICIMFLNSEINSVQYHRVVDQTLDELTEYLEELPDRGVCHSDYDVHLAVRVFTCCTLST